MRCDFKACVNQAVSGKSYCIYHDPELKIRQQSSVLPSEAFEFVPIGDVPSTARFSQAAADLVKAARSAEGKALKVKTKVFGKITLNTAVRYSLSGGARIGLRIVGEVAYLWKLRPEELKKIEEKSKRMINARSKRWKKPTIVHSA
jgi:hypothetical protein